MGDKYSVAITANRKLVEDDHRIIFNKMAELVTDPDVIAIYLGGAVGGDTVALEAALNICCMGKPKLIVAVPCKVENQPRTTHTATRMADEIVELGNPITAADGYASYKKRNIYMVDHAQKVVGFWSGDKKSGTWHALNYATQCDKDIEIVSIQGLDK